MADNYVSTADNPIEVPFSDDESATPDELLADEPTGASPEEAKNRKQKRTERIRRLLDEGKQNKEDAASLRAEQAALKSQLARLEGFVAASTRPAQQGPDPYGAALVRVRERQAREYSAAQAEIKAGTFTEERSKYYERVAAEIEDEKASIHTERVLAQRVPALRQEQAQQVWVSKYPDVYKNPNAFAYASATFAQRKALGDAESYELVDEVMNETMARFKIGPKKAPSATEKSRMSGLSASGSGGGSGGGPSGIPMTKELRKMAVSAYAGELNDKGKPMTEDEAVHKWVQGPGKELRKQKVL